MVLYIYPGPPAQRVSRRSSSARARELENLTAACSLLIGCTHPHRREKEEQRACRSASRSAAMGEGALEKQFKRQKVKSEVQGAQKEADNEARAPSSPDGDGIEAPKSPTTPSKTRNDVGPAKSPSHAGGGDKAAAKTPSKARSQGSPTKAGSPNKRQRERSGEGHSDIRNFFGKNT